MNGPWVTERVRWSDLDVMGIVYFGRYLRFMEAAEAEFFRALGFSYAHLSDELGVWLARVRLEVDYRAPARLDDEVRCRAELRQTGASSVTFAFPMESVDGQRRFADGMLVLACLDRETLRPVRVPDNLRDAIAQASESAS